jgi:hypothetical protein
MDALVPGPAGKNPVPSKEFRRSDTDGAPSIVDTLPCADPPPPPPCCTRGVVVVVVFVRYPCCRPSPVPPTIDPVRRRPRVPPTRDPAIDARE